jgi:cell division protein FtsB
VAAESFRVATRPTARAKSRPAKAGSRTPRKRPGLPRTTVVLRWCIVGVALFVAFLYYQPLSSYVQTRSALNERAAEVERLRDERTRLQARLADSETTTALAREARRMRLVRPGEKIFIVKGVAEWRRAQARAKAKATIGGDG